MKFEDLFPSVRKAKKRLRNTIEEDYHTRINLLNSEIRLMKKVEPGKTPYDKEYINLIIKEGGILCPEGLGQEIIINHKNILSSKTKETYVAAKLNFLDNILNHQLVLHSL